MQYIIMMFLFGRSFFPLEKENQGSLETPTWTRFGYFLIWDLISV